MLSIRPKWCELIASGRKTIEVRKTRPKLDPPFACYIYCTKPKFPHDDYIVIEGTDGVTSFYAGGKVIGAFVCDEIYEIPKGCVPTDYVLADMRMKGSEFHKYRGKGAVYCWHISNLAIYDTPQELQEFRRPLECHRGNDREDCVGCWDCEIKRPPQSWCYVEKI